MPAISRRALIAAGASFAPAVSRAAGTTLVVSKQGDGFRTVQAAIDAVPRGNHLPYTIQIAKGIYVERVTVPRDKRLIHLVGEDSRNTVITYNLSTATTSETRYSASAYVFADD